MNAITTPTQAYAAPELPDIWKDDKMGRRGYAEFLSTYINARITSTQKPLTAALDSSWGTGKTFFVERWAQQIEAQGGATIIFDAWKNDFATDPLLSFLAELTGGMKRLETRCGKLAKVKRSIQTQTADLVKNFRKAVVPASAIILKSLAKKYAGEALSEIAEAGTLSALSDVDWSERAGEFGESLEKGLEVFFKKALEDHKNRITATEKFRSGLESLVKMLQDEGAISGPLYIFIDELDRCRPDYSIRLLEGVKHTFAVPGVVFVFSTNLEQLSHSVRGVYGPTFNGFAYLKRFFDFEFALPDPDNYSFAQLLAKEQPLFSQRTVETALMEVRYKDEDRLARAFELIANALDIPLRDQRQIWTIAVAACSGISANHPVHVLWLFFLAAVKHLKPDAFEKLGSQVVGEVNFPELLTAVGVTRSSIVKALQTTFKQDSFAVTRQEEDVLLSTVLTVYRSASLKTLGVLSKESASRADVGSNYPESLTQVFSQEPRGVGVSSMPSIAQYVRLVKMAGLIG